MRLVEKQMLDAIRNRKDFCSGNTMVSVNGFLVFVYLHGNCIFGMNYKTHVKAYNSCGWRTPTTKSRLNALGADIYQKDKVWYHSDGSEFVDEDITEAMCRELCRE